MARLAFLLVLAVASLLGTSSGLQAAPRHIEASLLTSTEHPRPGQPFLIGLRLVPEKGWHTYWTNPGETGLAPTIKWEAPAGLTFGSLRHPAPTLLKVQGITSFVHGGEHVLLSRAKLDDTIAVGTPLFVTAHVRWLACSETLCVPGRANLQVELTAGDGAPGPSSALLTKAERRLPRPAGTGTFVIEKGELVLRLPDGLRIDVTRVAFFPDEGGAFDPGHARIQNVEGTAEIRTGVAGAQTDTLSGVVSDGDKAYHLAFLGSEAGRATATAKTGGQATGAPPKSSGASAYSNSRVEQQSLSPDLQVATSSWSRPAAFLAAIIGGLLLNLMPCVFPVLSLKALALARAGTSERSARIEALAYTAGSVLTCAALGIVIMLLRIAGAEVGWAFQLQHPGVTLLLALLATAITMNLAGVFELPSLSFSGAPPRPSGAWSSVASGSLTAFLATPCSGPFMAAALGATLVFSPEMSIAIYAGLGFGLALPMLLIAFVPRIRDFLPAPGRWMSTFKRTMAVFTALVAIALIWLLGRQAGAPALLEGALLILMLGVVLGWFGSRQKAGYQGRWLGVAPLAAAVSGLVLLWPSPVPVRLNTNGASVQMFSEKRLAQLRRQGIPVLIDITADWCLTCKVNERVAIDRPGTRAAFERAGIVILRGDWTNGDPAITRFLASHGRNSIPFYLFYPAGQAPQLLPQLLTPGRMRKLAASEEPKPRDRLSQE